MGLIEDLKMDFDLFYSDNKAYRAKVDGISELLGLHGKMQLRSDFLPTYIVGDYRGQESKYVLIGMNPGFSEEQNKQEEELKGGSWDRYQTFVKGFFPLFKMNGMKSPYYRTLSKLFAALDGISLTNRDQMWDYYHKHLVSIDIIPYHSAKIGIPKNLTTAQVQYFDRRFEACFEFVNSFSHRLVVMNGKVFYTLLGGGRFMKGDQTFKLTEKVTMHVFSYMDVPCIMFDYMITQSFSGIGDIHLEQMIPQIVRKCIATIGER